MTTTKTAQFTPGPWRSIKSGLIMTTDGRGIVAMPSSPCTALKGMIGTIEDNHDGHDGGYVVSKSQIAEEEANANLMAAAPFLYKALTLLLNELPEKRDWLNQDTERFAKMSLAEAEGREA